MRYWLRTYPVTAFVLITFLITAVMWSVLLLLYGRQPIAELISQPLAVLLIYLGAGGPTIAALLMTSANEGRAGLKDLGRRLVTVRFPLSVWLLAWAPVLLAAVATSLYALGSDALGKVVWPAWYLLLPVSAIPVFFAGPLCEETGWRGYLQPQLLKSHSPLMTALLIGTIWCFWHIPLSLTPGTTPPLQTGPAWLGYWLDTIVVSAVMLGIVVRAKGSIIAAMIFHWMSNIAFSQIIHPLFPAAAPDSWAIVHGIYLFLLVILALLLLSGLPKRGKQLA